jgi:hypothetical protein
MERLLARLERRLGRYAIPNLVGFIVGGMAIVWVLSLAKPDYQDHLALDIRAVRHGEVWRLVTFLFIPPPSSSLWILINLYFTWWVGSSLEQNWGAFKFNAYYVVGAIGTVIAAIVAGPATNFWLDASLFLAFATVFPDVKILLFFIIPIKVKWLGIVAVVGIAYAGVMGGWGTRGSIVASLANYVIFFGEHWYAVYKGHAVIGRQKTRRESLRAGARDVAGEPKSADASVFGQRSCAICGSREADGADIRVCSCEKCGGQNRTLCLEHARNH